MHWIGFKENWNYANFKANTKGIPSQAQDNIGKYKKGSAKNEWALNWAVFWKWTLFIRHENCVLHYPDFMLGVCHCFTYCYASHHNKMPDRYSQAIRLLGNYSDYWVIYLYVNQCLMFYVNFTLIIEIGWTLGLFLKAVENNKP